MRMVACPSGRGGVKLAAGTHTFSAANLSRPFESHDREHARGAPVTLSTPRARTATIQSWNAENRSIKVSAGPATYLAVAQNYNAGWTATLGVRRSNRSDSTGGSRAMSSRPGRLVW